jgi:hypothetical protein
MLNITEEVLAVLISSEINHKDIVTKLAVRYPAVLLTLLHDEDLSYHVQKAYNKGPSANKVEAIKKYRELTGAGLKDSKLAVESMISSNQIFYSEEPGEHQDDD